ncbi:MAG TPA: LysM peptidoglycan-binding domain-containing protein [Ilumatobacteraceae bacterium]|nr:LysM peptidoglycan-binding domain-containing protein [Ilumatobacteraceae bacterium]
MPANPTTTAVTTPAGATTTTVPGLVASAEKYTVKNNDTVYGIASKHNISPQALAQLNGWSDGINHAIHPGDQIAVPDGSSVSSSSTPSSSTAPSTTTTTPAPTTTIAVGGTYVIKENDYLAKIAKETGTTIDGIIAVNGWTDGIKHLLIPGDTIKLPATS